MKTIALVSQKGGVGKTSIACSLAVHAAERGARVIAIDLDEQGTLTDWGKLRPAAENLRVAALRGVADLPEILASLAGQGYDFAILDCPGKHDAESAIAIKAADLALIPSRPSTPDIKASVKTVRALVGLGRPFAFVLNQCPTSGHKRARAAADALAMLGELADPAIGQRIDFQDAMTLGQGVTETAADSKAAGEIAQLWTWALARLQKEDSACLNRPAAMLSHA